ncbi:hypothetical protein [Acinetobacter sp. ASP199]|uniref:putative pilus system protein FilF n=1 Tax=unclassified Acinetobacter TaxID=196816 RepID=UPI001F6059B9|nr:hypothetical protein [Acinetobacter sp. ASP199]
MNKNKIILPFAFSAMAILLQGCGGESADVIPEKYDSSTINGACIGTRPGCIEFALDYPLQTLDFYCGDDTKQTFITTYDVDKGVATGACKVGQSITFYILGKDERRVDLGSFSMNQIGNVTSKSHYPRMNLLDIAEGIRKTNSAGNLSQYDIAIRLVQLIQAMGLNSDQLRSATEIYPVAINDDIRAGLDQLDEDITVEKIKTLSDQDFDALLKTWLGPTTITKEQAKQVLQALLNISNAAVYQPEFSLFSTESIGSYVTGSEGLVGCSNLNRECSLKDTELTHILGHFILMTDRQGMTFGSGLQWKGKIESTTQNPGDFTTIGGLNAHLIRSIKPVQMTADAQNSWIDPETKQIANTPGYLFKVGDSTSEKLKIEQGRLYNDYMIAGKERFYKVLTGKSVSYNLNENEKRDLGLWQQTGGSLNFAGTMDLYKIYPITHLDRRVFKTQNNVQDQETYFFPLYGDLKFTLTNDSNRTINLGIVIDENGDIRTNIKPATAKVDECSAEFNPSTMQTTYSVEGPEDAVETVQQYRIGTVSRAFVPSAVRKKTDNTLSVRLVLANEVLGDLNGALIGMNSTIKTSTDGSSESIVVGGALVHLTDLFNVRVTGDGTNTPKPTISLTDSEGNTVKWANSFASFSQVYGKQNPSDEDVKKLAKLAGGTVSLAAADCYKVKVKS